MTTTLGMIGSPWHAHPVIDQPTPRREAIPPLTRTQARVLIGGAVVNVLGGAIGFWSIPDVRGFMVGWVLIVAGVGISFLGGGRRFVPSTPRQVLETARAGGLPAWPLTVLTFALLAIAAVGLLHNVVLSSPRH
ncbi:MAG TPA: hypothetical protein VFP72_03475 [Kineosporiaceae bacterium]|nr:hypothetical protein [Kineosporiaceae bacterium]